MAQIGINPKGAPFASTPASIQGGAAPAPAVLEIGDLRTHFFTAGGVVPAVDGVSYEARNGETLDVVGESGCGKSVSAVSIMLLVADPPGRIGGAIRFAGQTARSVRGRVGGDPGQLFR